MILVNSYVRLSVWIESRNAFINGAREIFVRTDGVDLL